MFQVYIGLSISCGVEDRYLVLELFNHVLPVVYYLSHFSYC